MLLWNTSNLRRKYLLVQSTCQKFLTNSNFHSLQLKANTSTITLHVMIINKRLNLRMTKGPNSAFQNAERTFKIFFFKSVVDFGVLCLFKPT